MLNKLLALGLFLMAIGSSHVFAARVAIMDFENKSQHGGWRVGRGAADVLTTHLVKETDFEIFERERLASVMQEQNLGESGRVDPTTAARIGKLIGVQYIVTGAVTEYGQSRSDAGGGGVKVGKKGYYASVDVRIVNATTGRIVFAETGNGKKSSVNVRVMGFGGGEKWNEKHATAAMRNAIKEVAQKIAGADLSAGGKSSASGGPIGEIKVADVDGKVLTLNKGENAGVKVGDTFTVKRQSKVIKDPESGAILKVRYKTLGKVKITSVEVGYSEGTLLEGAGIQNGDLVTQ